MDIEEVKKGLDAKFKAVEDQLAAAQKNGATKAEIAAISDTLKTQGIALQDFIDAQAAKNLTSTRAQLKNFLTENKDKIEELRTQKHGVIEFVPKEVGNMSTGSGGDASTPPTNFNTALGTFNYRDDSDLLAKATITSTDSAALVYTELEPKEGGYEFVSEGATKPQIDFKWANRYAQPYKAAAYEVFSEESVTDIARLESVGRQLLAKRHDLFKASAVYFGSGAAGIPSGATTLARTFVAGDMALAVDSPNFMDVVNAGITDIYTTHNYTDEASYEANLVLVNPVDFYIELVSAKDGNGLPLYPQAGLFNQVTIGGVTIRPWVKIPAGKIFIGDMKVYNVVNYIPFTIRIGWINAQFISNQFTVLGESRYYAYVKNLDLQALIYDDIATIRTAITKV